MAISCLFYPTQPTRLGQLPLTFTTAGSLPLHGDTRPLNCASNKTPTSFGATACLKIDPCTPFVCINFRGVLPRHFFSWGRSNPFLAGKKSFFLTNTSAAPLERGVDTFSRAQTRLRTIWCASLSTAFQEVLFSREGRTFSTLGGVSQQGVLILLCERPPL